MTEANKDTEKFASGAAYRFFRRKNSGVDLIDPNRRSVLLLSYCRQQRSRAFLILQEKGRLYNIFLRHRQISHRNGYVIYEQFSFSHQSR
jgi:hypothetical protein